MASSPTPPLILPGSPGYDEGRATWDQAVEQRPRAVVPATSADDVVHAVRWAASEGLGVAALGTGHGFGTATDDSAILVTTAGMAGTRVDADRRTAVVAAGSTWGDVVAQSSRHGLAPLCGAAPGVGAVSYTLGGGLGPLGRAYGYAADHVRWCEVVTADGALRRVGADDEPELFWALRGAGASLGVVTALEVDLFPVAELYGGGLFFAYADIDAVAAAFVATTAGAPDELSLSLALLTFPDLPMLPDPLRGKAICHVRVAYCGSSYDAAAELVAPLHACATPVLDTVQAMPFSEVGSIHADPTAPRPVEGRTMTATRLDDDLMGAIVDRARAGLPFLVEVRHLGGALGRAPEPTNCVGQRDAAATIYTTAYDATMPAVGPMQDELLGELADHRSGALPNFLLGGSVTADELRACYDADSWQRLRDIKAAVDPGSMFRYHQHNALADSP